MSLYLASRGRGASPAEEVSPAVAEFIYHRWIELGVSVDPARLMGVLGHCLRLSALSTGRRWGAEGIDEDARSARFRMAGTAAALLRDALHRDVESAEARPEAAVAHLRVLAQAPGGLFVPQWWPDAILYTIARHPSSLVAVQAYGLAAITRLVLNTEKDNAAGVCPAYIDAGVLLGIAADALRTCQSIRSSSTTASGGGQQAAGAGAAAARSDGDAGCRWAEGTATHLREMAARAVAEMMGPVPLKSSVAAARAAGLVELLCGELEQASAGDADTDLLCAQLEALGRVCLQDQAAAASGELSPHNLRQEEQLERVPRRLAQLLRSPPRPTPSYDVAAVRSRVISAAAALSADTRFVSAMLRGDAGVVCEAVVRVAQESTETAHHRRSEALLLLTNLAVAESEGPLKEDATGGGSSDGSHRVGHLIVSLGAVETAVRLMQEHPSDPQVQYYTACCAIGWLITCVSPPRRDLALAAGALGAVRAALVAHRRSSPWIETAATSLLHSLLEAEGEQRPEEEEESSGDEGRAGALATGAAAPPPPPSSRSGESPAAAALRARLKARHQQKQQQEAHGPDAAAAGAAAAGQAGRAKGGKSKNGQRQPAAADQETAEAERKAAAAMEELLRKEEEAEQRRRDAAAAAAARQQEKRKRKQQKKRQPEPAALPPARPGCAASGYGVSSRGAGGAAASAAAAASEEEVAPSSSPARRPPLQPPPAATTCRAPPQEEPVSEPQQQHGGGSSSQPSSFPSLPASPPHVEARPPPTSGSGGAAVSSAGEPLLPPAAGAAGVASPPQVPAADTRAAPVPSFHQQQQPAPPTTVAQQPASSALPPPEPPRPAPAAAGLSALPPWLAPRGAVRCLRSAVAFRATAACVSHAAGGGCHACCELHRRTRRIRVRCWRLSAQCRLAAGHNNSRRKESRRRRRERLCGVHGEAAGPGADPLRSHARLRRLVRGTKSAITPINGTPTKITQQQCLLFTFFF